MKKRFSFLLFLLVIFTAIITFAACSNGTSETPAYDTPTGITVAYGSTLADITLPEGFTWQDATDTSVGDVGEHVFLVTYTPADTKYDKVTDIQVTITVTKGAASYTAVVAVDAVYGQTLDDIALPAGFSWQEGGTTSVGTAGEHVFHVVYTPTDTARYEVVRDLPVTVRVAKATYDMTGVTFGGAQYTYDGAAKSLLIAGTPPTGVTVSYENNGKTEAGTYDVVAHFAGDENYNAIADMHASLVILKSDIAGLAFADSRLTYDGAAHSIAVTGTLPTGVSVSYFLNGAAFSGATDAGSYEVVAHFTVNGNYNNVPDMTATLTIDKATVSGITFEGATLTYDGEEHSIVITGTLPAGVSVAYTDNVGTDAGDHMAVATFTQTGDNYVLPEPLTAALRIKKARVDLSSSGCDKLLIPTGSTINAALLSAKGFDGFSVQSVKTYDYIGNYLQYLRYNNNNSNYYVENKVPLLISVYDLGVHTVRADSEHRAIKYFSELDLTVRLATSADTDLTYDQMLGRVGSEPLMFYVYSGDKEDKTESELASMIPFDVYGVNVAGGIFNVTKTYYDSYAVVDEYTETLCYLVFDQTTLEMSLADLGEVKYLYVDESGDVPVTYAFKQIGEGESAKYYVYSYQGSYTLQTLPAYGRRVYSWSETAFSQDEIYVDETGGRTFKVVKKDGADALTLYVGEEVVYTFQYTYDTYDEYGEVNGIKYAVLSFNKCKTDVPDSFVYYAYRYAFDEEVDLSTIDLSAYEPVLLDEWDIIEGGESAPDVVSLQNFPEPAFAARFIVNQDGSLSFDFANGYYYHECFKMDNGYTFYYIFRPNHIVYDGISDSDDCGTWRYDAASGKILATIEGEKAVYDVSTHNLGTVTCHVGEIIGMFESDKENGMTVWSVLTKEGDAIGIYSYVAASYLDVLDGSVQPIFVGMPGYFTFEDDDKYVYLKMLGETLRVLEKTPTKLLPVYYGDIVYSYEYAGGSGAPKCYTLNNVLGYQLAFHYINGELDDEGVLTWEYHEFGDFINLYYFIGSYVPDSTFRIVTDSETQQKSLELIGEGAISGFDYFYHSAEVDDPETGDTIIEQSTWLTILQGSGYGTIFVFDGTLTAKDFPTLAELMDLDDDELEDYGIVDKFTFRSKMSKDMFHLSADNVRGVPVYMDGISMSLGYGKVDYRFYNAEENETVIFYTDGATKYYRYYPGDVSEEVAARTVDYYEPMDYSWSEAEIDGQKYIYRICNDCIVDGFLIEDGNFVDIEEYLSGNRVYYFAESESTRKFVFYEIGGVKRAYLYLDDKELSDEELAHKDSALEGIWMQDGDYVVFYYMEYVPELGCYMDHEFDMVLFRLENGVIVEEFADDDAFKGTVTAVLVLGSPRSEATYAFIHYFNEIRVRVYDGVLTVKEAEDALYEVNGLVPYDCLQSPDEELPGRLFLIGGKLYAFTEEGVSLAEYEVVWYVNDEEGDPSVFVICGDQQLVFSVEDADSDALAGDYEDYCNIPFWDGYNGTWEVSSKDPNVIICYDGWDSDALTVLDREGHQLMWEDGKIK